MRKSDVPVITIDGPSASGKGTVSQRLAQQLGWHWLDSGALYRAIAWYCLEQSTDIQSEEAILAAIERVSIDFHQHDQQVAVEVNGKLVDHELRTEACGNMASKIAAMAAVRQALLGKQRCFRKSPGLVADGRDMGTIVFCDAPLKIFLTASPEIRAQRRYNQLKDKGTDANLAGLLQEIMERDQRDQGRSVAPLKAADDANCIDSSNLSVDKVLEKLIQLATNAGLLGARHKQ